MSVCQFSRSVALLFHFHQEAFEFLFTFCHKGGVICISEVTDISPGNLDYSVMSSSLRRHGLHSLWNSPGQNTGVGRLSRSHSLLQGIFPTQESNPGLLNCRQILYLLSTREALRTPKVLFKIFSKILGDDFP